MADMDAALDKGQAALGALYTLQDAAMKSGDLAGQKALQDQIDDLTYKLTQLSSAAIAADQAQIDALGQALDAVTAQANGGLKSLSNLTAVLQSVVAITKLADCILQAVAPG